MILRVRFFHICLRSSSFSAIGDFFECLNIALQGLSNQPDCDQLCDGSPKNQQPVLYECDGLAETHPLKALELMLCGECHRRIHSK